MNCPDCGSVLRPGDSFCPKCGRSSAASPIRAGGAKQVVRSLLGNLDRWYRRFRADLESSDHQVRNRARIIAGVGVVVLLALLSGGGLTRLIGVAGLIFLGLMPLAASLRRSV